MIYALAVYFIFNNQFTLGGFAAVVTYFGICTSSLVFLNNKITNIARNKASVERIQEILNMVDESDLSLPECDIVNGDIVFENVAFSYDKSTPILSNINMEIEGGKSHLL